MNLFAIRAWGRLAAGGAMLLTVGAGAADIPPATAVPAAKADAQFLASANNALALNLYRQLAGDADGNVFFSPHSIATVLTMTWAGARGDTAAQLAKALGFNNQPATQIAAASGEWQNQLREALAKSGPRLLAANSLWPQADHPIRPEYVALIKNNFSADITPVDYQTRAAAAVQRINAWVEDKTEKRITDLLHPGDVTPDTRLILVDAIYFKGAWAEKFDAAKTAMAPFTVKGGEPKEVGLMHQKMDAARLAEVADSPVPLQILTLP
ncbi:MAG TPA: serpin family protein, partial [Verrucomicrobiae bacterium]|nr:serpin family protein [Verrucomicrobiae bacterium]